MKRTQTENPVEPVFSIVTVCRNPGPQVRQALQSLHVQSWQRIEHIVVDGCSTDGTTEYILSLGDHVSHFISEPDAGLYDALNKGIRVATGDIVGVLHADDVYPSEEVLSSVAGVFERTGADAVYGDLLYVRKRDPHRVVRHWRSGAYDPRRLAWGWMPPHPALFVRRQVYELARLEAGEYYDTSLRIAADYDFMLRILAGLDISVVYFPEVLMRMTWGGVSNRDLISILRKSSEDYRAIRRNRIGGLGTLLAKNIRKLPQFAGRSGIVRTMDGRASSLASRSQRVSNSALRE